MERWYGEGEECRVLVRECQCEVEKLKAERERLLERIRVIDQDVQAVGSTLHHYDVTHIKYTR